MADNTSQRLNRPARGAARVFNFLAWLPGYTRSELRGDLIAGVTVGVMLVPQGMAYAVLGGVPPIYGLYASLVPLVVYPVFGTSRHLAVGIVAIDMLILTAGLTRHADVGSAEYIALAITTALMVGVIQVVMGIARLGFMVNLLSRPVISGFTAAAALTIGLTQLRNLLGVDIPRTADVVELVAAAFSHAGDAHVLSLVIGAGGIVLLLLLRRFVPLAPGPLLAVVLGILAVWLLRLDQEGVEVVGVVPTGPPTPSFSGTSLETFRQLLPTAVTLSLVQFMSVISLGKVFAAKHRYRVRANRELFALGMINVAGSLFRSVPVSGSFSRSAVGDQAGGRTPMANVVAAGVIVMTLLFLTPLFFFLPVPIFASIIMVSAFALIDVRELRFLLRTKKVDGGIAVLTFIATLIIGIHEGVLIGITASVVAIMYRISRPNVAILGHLPGTRSFRDIRRYTKAEIIEGVLILRIDASFSFVNAEFLRDLIIEQSNDPERDIRAVLIDASSVNDLDTTAATLLASVAETLTDRKIDLYFGGVKGPVLDVMRRHGFAELVGEDHFFLSPHRAILHILREWDRMAVYLDAVPNKQQPGVDERD